MVDWQEALNDLSKLMHETPFLKENLKELGEQELIEELPQCFTTIETLIKNVNTPLKVVIMGEVKSGKSTLFNAIVGEEISPADVLETTACIIELKYAPKPYGIIRRDDKEIASGDAEKIFAILSFNQGNHEFFHGSVTVEIGLPLLVLKQFYLVDTPGILSVNDKNMATAKNYIKEADVVLWVLNAHHLGQTDLTEELKKVADYGKPIVGVINRIDQVDGEIERLVDYVKEEMGIYLKEVFAVSAKKAWRSIKEDNKEFFEESLLNDLLVYLQEEIGSKAWEVKEESIYSSTVALVEKFVNLHLGYWDKLDMIHNEVVIYEKELELRASEIERKIESYLKVQVFETLFTEEMQELDQRIQRLSMATSAEEKAALVKEINSSFGPEVINKWWEETEKVISSMYSTEWWDAAKEIQDSKLRMLEEFDRLERFAVTGNLKKTELNAEAAALDGLGQGLFLGTAFGVGLASYSVYLGSAATYVSLGTALTTFIPPLAIAGGLAGMLSKAWQAEKDRKEFVSQLRSAVNKARDELWENVIEVKVLANLRQNSTRTVAMLKDAYLSQLLGNWNMERLENTERELKDYLERLEEYKKINLETKETV